jgi:enoyl-CoA hydratase/carnithine racemase
MGVSHADLAAQTAAIAERIAESPPLALRMVKESLNRGLDAGNMAEAAYVDLYRFLALELTDDAQESHSAWREKRLPEVRGS